MAPFSLCLLFLAVARPALAACRLSPDADVVVYVGAGVGPYSQTWTRAFFAWLSAANPDLVVSYAEADDLNAYYDGSACVLADGDAFLSIEPGVMWQAPVADGVTAITDALIEASVWAEEGGSVAIIVRGKSPVASGGAIRSARAARQHRLCGKRARADQTRASHP